MISLSDYQQVTGYKPVPGEKCPECKAVCGPGGPDHHGTCTLMAKLWNLEKNPDSAIPALPGVDVTDPRFGVWAAQLATRMFSQPAALPKGGIPTTPVVPAAVPAPLKA